MSRKSDGRKSSAPKKLPVLEGDESVERTESLDSTKYSILGSYLNSSKRSLTSSHFSPGKSYF